MPSFNRTHAQCIKTVCAVCIRSGDQELSEAYIKKVLQFIQSNISCAPSQSEQPKSGLPPNQGNSGKFRYNQGKSVGND